MLHGAMTSDQLHQHSDTYMSKGAPPPARKRQVGRAGHQYISIEQLGNVWAGFGHSTRIGLRPNATFDIHFDKGGLHDPLRHGLPCLKAFLKSSRQWVERKGHQTCCIWAMENRGDGLGYGVHAHVIMHIPPTLNRRFHELRKGWQARAGLNVTRSGVVNYEPLPTFTSAKGKLKYMSKDLDPRWWSLFKDITGRVHLDDRGKPSDQPILGKKCGVSRNIDARARGSYHQLHQTDPDAA